MDPRVAPLHATLRLNTRLLLNCLEGLDDTAAGLRPNVHTNSMGFIAAPLVDVVQAALNLFLKLVSQGLC